MKYKLLRKDRPRCGEVPPPSASFPNSEGLTLWCRCRRLVGHKGKHQGGAYGRWSG